METRLSFSSDPKLRPEHPGFTRSWTLNLPFALDGTGGGKPLEKIFLQACRGEPTAYTPIWLNRQAGRYMPEYHAVKGSLPSLDFFKNPDRAAQATLDAQRILGVDAAILFADLLPIMEPMGLELDYKPGEGPVFANPVRSTADIDKLVNAPAEEATPYIAETVRNVLAGLPPEVALIGFAGAPFTLASYAVEGRGSRNYVYVKKLMYEDPAAFARLMDKLVTQVVSYLELQIDAGADAVQLFDSWVGCLSVADFEHFVLPYVRRLIGKLPKAVPVIYFGTGNSHLLGSLMRARPDVVALDWRVSLKSAWQTLGCKAVQGNLDPIVLCADRATIAAQSQRVLDEAGGRPGHIFNLGHGIIPETPVDNVKYLVDYVHEHGASTSGKMQGA